MSLVRRSRWSAALLQLALLCACGDDDAPRSDGAVEPSTGVQGDGGVVNMGASMDAGTTDPTQVTLKQGKLQGDVVAGAVRFLKIPFAKPPVGALRWRAPEDAEGWTGVRHELAFSSPCAQPPSSQSPASVSEDCLYLNVWRPTSAAKNLPVMVWIHGGGFTTGSAADIVPRSMDQLWYDGRPFAERELVVVTLNYRLGVFGFFPHPALAGEGTNVGNQGLLDQRKALQWVRDNIAAFGGDPGKVTLFGESAGAGSVCLHVVSPGSRGLFHRAISQSGGCTAPSRTNLPDLQAQIAQFGSERGCPAGAEALACLRNKPASELVSMTAVDRSMGMEALRRSLSFGPVGDGPSGFLPEPPSALFARREVAQVPYILGSNAEEARLYFTSAMVPATEEAYRAAIQQRYGAFAERVLALYPSARFGGDYRKTMAAISSDSGLICSTLDTARKAVSAGLTVYMYNFNIPWSIAREALGASHASEISHVFGTPFDETPESTMVATAMNAYWASFARSGDPNHPGAPKVWPRFMPDENGDDLRLQLDPQYEVLRSFRKEECALWQEVGLQ